MGYSKFCYGDNFILDSLRLGQKLSQRAQYVSVFYSQRDTSSTSQHATVGRDRMDLAYRQSIVSNRVLVCSAGFCTLLVSSTVARVRVRVGSP